MRRVVVTGLGVISPAGLTVEQSWQNLLACNSGVSTIESFDCSNLPVKIAAEVKNFDPLEYLDPKEAKKSTRFVQFALAAALQAQKDAKLDTSKLSDRFGCAIGVGIGSIQDIFQTSLQLSAKGPKRVSPFFIPYVIANMASGIVAKELNLRGPNICPTTACSSGTHAVGESFLYIKNNMADVMICGGSEASICELSVAGFANMKALSRNNEHPQTASRPFDKDRDGFVMGEGSGILVLEELEHAKARGANILAEVVGCGMSGDAHHITTPPPEGEGAQRCMQAALDSAEIQAHKLDYINAHGTSTYFNDIYESQAIMKVFGDHAKNLSISSSKGVFGHCLGAAGGIEAVVLVKSIMEQLAPPTANLVNQDPECPLNYVPLDPKSQEINYAMSNSFGFGGTNVSLVMKRI